MQIFTNTALGWLAITYIVELLLKTFNCRVVYRARKETSHWWSTPINWLWDTSLPIWVTYFEQWQISKNRLTISKRFLKLNYFKRFLKAVLPSCWVQFWMCCWTDDRLNSLQPFYMLTSMKTNWISKKRSVRFPGLEGKCTWHWK